MVFSEKFQIEQEGKEIEEIRERYKMFAQKEKREPYEKELREIGERSLNYRTKIISVNHELHSLELLMALHNVRGNPAFERIIVGGGVAATMVYTRMPPEFTQAKQSDGLPSILVLNDNRNPNTWPKEGKRLMGQPAFVQTPPLLGAHPESFAIKENKKSNPYDYVVAENFYSALQEAQNNMNMTLVNLKAIELQSKDRLTTQAQTEQHWEHAECKHRIVVAINEGVKKYLYTSSIDLCIGLGDPRRLTSTQLAPGLSAVLAAQKKLLYAQDGDIEIKGDVIFYGGSAINAAWIAEVAAGYSSSTAKIVSWITPKAESFENASRLNRMIAYAMTTHKDRLALGTLESVELQSNGQLELTFSSYAPQADRSPSVGVTKVSCDQLIVSIGQVEHSLTAGLENFVPCYYQPSVVDRPMPLGTHSPDKSIVTWGAAGSLGTGLSSSEKQEFIDLVRKHAGEFPHESQALGGILISDKRIETMVQKFQNEGVFPSSSSHKTQTPLRNINSAMPAEIKAVITCGGRYNEEQCQYFVDKIIKLRSTPKNPSTCGLSGICSLASLASLSLPLPVLTELQQAFFPFESMNVILNSKKPANLDFFSDRETTEDASIFMSSAANDSGPIEGKAVAPTMPLIIDRKME